MKPGMKKIYNPETGMPELVKKQNEKKTLYSLLKTLPLDIPIDIIGDLGPLCVGKTAEWILSQGRFDSITELLGREVKEHNLTNKRIAIILK